MRNGECGIGDDGGGPFHIPHSTILIPLDDRPINVSYPALLARVAGAELCRPPRALLGRFLTPGDPEGLLAWLHEASGDARAAILSLDMLAHGGLVASRTPDAPVEVAERRLDALRALKARRPGLKLYAFSVIMRLTITGSDPEMAAAGEDVFRYSVLRDRAERLGDPEAAAELAVVTARIPPRVLDGYLAARARNHAVNRLALDLLRDGVLDFLALVQEDTAPTGLHVPEQQALLAHAADIDPARWRLYPGADEAAQTLLARRLLDEAGLRAPMRLALRDPHAAETPALFEDVPLAEAARRHMEAAGLARERPREHTDPSCAWGRAHAMAFAVHTFDPPQRDVFDFPPADPTWEAALAAFPRRALTPWLAGLGLPDVAMADCAYCNGGDPWLAEALLAGGAYPALAAYGGWNTAGNTLGTVAAHGALAWLAGRQGITAAMGVAQADALFVRLLDDVLYQSIVRPWAVGRARVAGYSPYNLGAHAETVADEVDAAMQNLWREVCRRHESARALDRPFRATLPWGRLFEVRVRLSPEGR